MVHPCETAGKGPVWADLLDQGVKSQDCTVSRHGDSDHSAVFWYKWSSLLYPQIPEEAGVEVLLSNLGISSESASLLITFTTLLMLPCNAIAMLLIDISGRR
ncbi:unnamed protein product [Linum trigynum]|uniref:Uncharacterized protein n=1 Tax=Linum trigynum TaxID=586398 RepID=A0AAV2ED09_9ROSI